MAGKILIADSVPTNRILLKVKLSTCFYDVVQATSGADCQSMAQKTQPDIVILGAELGDQSATETISAFKTNPHLTHIPILVITSETDTDTKIAALKAGADDFLASPLDDLALMARLRALMRTATAAETLRKRNDASVVSGFCETRANFDTPGKITLVGTTLAEAMGWRAGLRGLMSADIAVEHGDHLLERIHNGHISDIYVLPARFKAGYEGLRLISDLRARAATRDAGIVVMHGAQDRNEALMALDLGANDLVLRGADPEEMALRLQMQLKRKRQIDHLHETLDEGLRLASLDSLTGLKNRRYALSNLETIASDSCRLGQQFALFLIDIDHFKAVNDTYGHATGDAALVEVSRRLQNALRDCDLLARFGGEEFLACLPATGLFEARAIAERLRQAICATPVAKSAAGIPVNVSISIGLAMGEAATGERAEIPNLISIADQALYAAKAEGRNQVTLGAYVA